MASSSLEGEWSIKDSADSLVVSIIVQAASTAELEVDVAPTRVSVRDTQSTHRLDLPCTVMPDSCQVRFRRSKRELQLVLARAPLPKAEDKQMQQQPTECNDQDDDDDDDLPPPLEAARSAPCKSTSEDLASGLQRAVDAVSMRLQISTLKIWLMETIQTSTQVRSCRKLWQPGNKNA